MENQNLNDPSKQQSVEKNQTELDESIPLSQEYEEETAAELVTQEDSFVQETGNDESKSMYGWIAIALSIISFFWIPLLFATAGIILGFISRSRHASALGNIAIAVGVISILSRLLILPLL